MARGIEGGLRSAYRALQQAIVEDPGTRPRQFTLEGQPRSRRQRQSGEQVARDATPEEQRPPRVSVRNLSSAPASPRQADLRAKLHDRASLRSAILLHEILDRPRALRPLEWE